MSNLKSTEWSMDDLKAALPNLKPKELLLDVRTPEEFAEGHVEGAKNISHDEVTFHADELKPYERIYIYCRRGGRAMAAYEALTQMGFKNLICVSKNGMMYWEEKKYPMQK